MRQQSRKSLRGGRREAALEVMWRSQEGAAVPDPADRSGEREGESGPLEVTLESAVFIEHSCGWDKFRSEGKEEEDSKYHSLEDSALKGSEESWGRCGVQKGSINI